MNLLNAFTAVYSYTTPEVRRVIADLTQSYPGELIDEGWVRSDLTKFQDYAFAALIALRSEEVLGLTEFNFRYPTYGSDHAICEYMTHLKVDERLNSIYVFENDYEGYVERAKSRGLEPVAIPITAKPEDLVSGVWFISNPSARDGNVLPPDVIENLLNSGHRVVYDLAYLGTTDVCRFDLRHNGIDAAFVSLSKPYGLFSHRIGLSFFRRSVPSLVANELWFKNIFGLKLASEVLTRIDGESYARKYKARQAEIVAKLKKEGGLPLTASDAFLLAHITEANAESLTQEQQMALKRYKRGPRYRFCLTPFFAEGETIK
jgi:histidinol-phosphate/aromatic aminotransferase/cobyric acid decarboxylase-like protein